jgi:hypothetical protein
LELRSSTGRIRIQNSSRKTKTVSVEGLKARNRIAQGKRSETFCRLSGLYPWERLTQGVARGLALPWTIFFRTVGPSIPELRFVLLTGLSGSGKSPFTRKRGCFDHLAGLLGKLVLKQPRFPD